MDLSVNEEEKPTVTKAPPQFIPKLIGQKIVIRLISGGQPLTGVLEAYNPYEILLKTAKGNILVFKHAIAVIEMADSPFS
jgi:sRNA-binding regulator protein Hfq